jgi:chorismate dehydratase
VDGPPSELNRLLASGELDIAPGSSIELARHSREYGALSGLCIGSDGPVESIVLASRRSLARLHGETVALPTASASSRCLLRILLETRLGVNPIWVDFDQETMDPMRAVGWEDARSGAHSDAPAAALFIGDVALRRQPLDGELRIDLGAEWTDWTGLPFVYALWLVRAEAARLPETRELHRSFLDRLEGLPAAYDDLAAQAGDRFGFPPARLREYWSRIRYALDERMLAGLERFLDLAVELGESPSMPHIRLLP